MNGVGKPAGISSERLAWLAGWAMAALILIAGSGAAALNQDFAEPDNAMRLIRVRDMLAGQAWFDQMQYRLNPPDGTPMHWARWIDGALAAPIALLIPVIGQQAAEIALAFAWPLGLLGLFMFLAVKVCGEIGARDGLKSEAQIAGAVVAALAFPAIDKFMPGSFDHHNVELILGLVAVFGLMRMHTNPRIGGAAGLALGVAMATAAEGVPLVMAGLVVGGSMWLVKPEAYSRGLAWLGGGLAVSSLVMFPILVAPSEWGRPVCDAMSTPFLAIGLLGGGMAVTLGAGLPEQFGARLVGRIASAGVLGTVAAAALAVLFPQCLGGGYAELGADVQRLWLSQVSESRSLVDLASDDPALILTMAGAAFAGLVAATFYLWRHRRQTEGWILLGFLLIAWAVLAWQIRGAAFATTFAIPFGAWAVARARRSYRAKASVFRLLALGTVAASSAAAAWATAGEALQQRFTPRAVLSGYEARIASAEACVTPAAYKSLNAVPTGLMLNHFSLGAGILTWTDHTVLAAPYHRGIKGTMKMINALRSTSDEARSLILESKADYVLVCPAMRETMFYAANPAESGTSPEETLSSLLGEGTNPDWLEPVEISEKSLRLYRVIR
jgi:hypothetical protein